MVHVLEVQNPRVVEVLPGEKGLIELGRMNVGERTEQGEGKENDQLNSNSTRLRRKVLVVPPVGSEGRKKDSLVV